MMTKIDNKRPSGTCVYVSLAFDLRKLLKLSFTTVGVDFYLLLAKISKNDN